MSTSASASAPPSRSPPGQVPLPGGVLAIAPEHFIGWLGPLPVEALHGIGPRQAAALRDYGIHCVGLLAAVPPATVQRLPGGKTGRPAADRARGVDPRPVVPRALPSTASVHHRLDEHTLEVPPSAPPSSAWSSGSAPGCAPAARPPAP